MKVVVTWMDGTQETCQCQDALVHDGVLWLNVPHYPATDELNRRIPLNNIKIWTVPS